MFQDCGADETVFNSEFDFIKGWFFDEPCDLKRQYSGMMYIHALYAKYHATMMPLVHTFWVHFGHICCSLAFVACIIILDIRDPTGAGRAPFMGMGLEEPEEPVEIVKPTRSRGKRVKVPEVIISAAEGRSMVFWIYVGVGTFALFKLFGAYFRYFNATVVDLNRRTALLESVSESLEMDKGRKSKVTVQMPVFNYIDSVSMVSWVQARQLVLHVGTTFARRMYIYTSVFNGVTLIIDLFLLGCLTSMPTNFMPSIKSNVSLEAQYTFLICAFFQNVFTLRVFVARVRLNKQSQIQIAQIVALKDLLLQLTTSPTMAQCDVKDLRNRALQRCVTYVRTVEKGGKDAVKDAAIKSVATLQ